MNIFDVHVHIFPDKIADKATQAIGKFYDIPMQEGGKLSQAVEMLKKAGVTHFAAHSVATTPAQVENINKFILAAKEEVGENLIPFAAMHPDMENPHEYVEKIIAQGFRGVKIHPDIQGFQVDDEHVLEMIGAVAGKLPLLVHCGDNRYDNSGPARIAHVLDAFPQLTMLCAHLGGYSQWDEAAKILAGRKNIYVDTSSSLFRLEKQHAVELIYAYGVENTFFGTDFPMWEPQEEMERFMALPLTDAQRQMILFDNAARFFNLV